MIISVLLVGMMAGFLVRHLAPPIFDSAKRFRTNNRKYVCDGCKSRYRKKNGYVPVPVDLDVGDSLIPLNLSFCRKCVPPNA